MNERLAVTVLVENTPVDGLLSEHGLSLLVARGGTQLLLDFGQSDAFARNARTLCVDLTRVDHAVLSHAHYDHANGMGSFFELNSHAPLRLSAACGEACWSTKGGTTEAHYIGIGTGLLERYADRLYPVATDGTTTIARGIHLVPHTAPGLGEIGRRSGMLLHGDEGWRPDNFAHELSLVIELGEETDTPLVVFNSCSHAGLDVIAEEVKAAFPERSVEAFFGGLHLVHTDDEGVLAVAKTVRSAGIGHVWTGHCTGSHAFELLKHELPGQVSPLYPGLRVVF